jgi:hypothetical protein
MRHVMLTALLALVAGAMAAPRRVPKTLAPNTHVHAEGAQRKVVFLHVQDTGGTSFMSWIGQVHAMCARNATSEEAQIQAETKFLLNLNDKQSVKDFKEPTDHEAGGAEKLASCGPARKICHFGFKSEWPPHTTVCQSQVQRYVQAGCTFVELHHFDISVAEAFKKEGYEVMTMLRNPVERIKSEMTKTLHATGNVSEAFDDYQRVYSPDNGIRLLTSCDERQWNHQEDTPTSCSIEFQTNGDKFAQAISANIEQELNDTMPAYCDKHANSTSESYEVLYNIASRYMQGFSFIGVLERIDTMINAWVKHFGVTMDTIPVVPKDVPDYCLGGSCNEHFMNMSVALNEAQIKGLVSYDYQLWCDASAKLTKIAGDVAVEGKGLQYVTARCSSSPTTPSSS